MVTHNTSHTHTHTHTHTHKHTRTHLRSISVRRFTSGFTVEGASSASEPPCPQCEFKNVYHRMKQKTIPAIEIITNQFQRMQQSQKYYYNSNNSNNHEKIPAIPTITEQFTPRTRAHRHGAHPPTTHAPASTFLAAAAIAIARELAMPQWTEGKSLRSCPLPLRRTAAC